MSITLDITRYLSGGFPEEQLGRGMLKIIINGPANKAGEPSLKFPCLSKRTAFLTTILQKILCDNNLYISNA